VWLAITVDFVKALAAKFPAVSAKSQEVVDKGSLIPEVDYKGTRGYIESVAKQINASYERNVFDGCAVLMRRLLEVLLILSYRKQNIFRQLGNFSAHKIEYTCRRESIQPPASAQEHSSDRGPAQRVP
jgi:hypothetical protein